MAYNVFYVFVEGEDDERFFNHVVKPRLERKNDVVIIRKYATLEKSTLNAMISAVRNQSGADYMLVADLDRATCVRKKKATIERRYRRAEPMKVVVAIREIESWYVSGLRPDALNKLGLPGLANPEDVSKEDFNSMIPKKFGSRRDLMMEILKHFSMSHATTRNRSIQYLERMFLIS